MQQITSASRKVLPFAILTLAGLFLLYEFVLQVSPSVITHQMMEAFHVNAFVLGVTMSLYYYTYAPMQLFAGLSFDKYGARKTLTPAILVCALGTACLALAVTYHLAGLSRLLTGLGSAFSFVGMLFLGRRWFATKYFFIIVALTEFMGAMGAFIGQAPVSSLIEHFGWRQTLWGLAFFGVALSVLVWLVIRDKSEDCQNSQSQSLSVWQSLIYIVRHLQLWAIGLHAMLVFAPVTAFTALWGVPYLVNAYHISTTEAGAICSMVWIGMAVGTPILGGLTEKLKRRRAPLVYCALLGAVTMAIILYVPNLSTDSLYVLMLLMGIGTSGQATSFLVVTDNVPKNIIGTAMGFNNLLIVLSGAIFQPIVGGLLDLNWSGLKLHGVPVYSHGDYSIALSILPLCFIAAALIGRFWMRETHCSPVV